MSQTGKGLVAWYERLLRALRRGPGANEFAREISFHLAERADDLVAQGMSRGEALREARRRFGSRYLRQAHGRRAGALLRLESVLADTRYAVRSMRRSPGFAVVAIVSLGLGIGANTAIFSLYNALVLRTLPVQSPQELVQVTFGDERTTFTNPLWEELRDQQNVLAGVFAFGNASFNLADGGQVRNVTGYWVSGDFFSTLGVMPVAGRLLSTVDDYRGCPAVAAVSYGLWQREFGGASDAVGARLSLNGKPFEVVGVVEPSFSGVQVGRANQVYAPICAIPIVFPDRGDMLDARSSWFLQVLGRPERGHTAAQAGARLAVLSAGVFGATVPDLWDSEGQDRYRAYRFGARPAPNGLSPWREQYRVALLVLLAAVGVVLLIACGNVANLLLARATRRRHEVSIRRAIGSGRGRLIRLLVTESLLISLVSTVVAVLFARWASTFLVGMLSTTSGDLWLDLSLDVRVLGFTLLVAVATGIVFGLAPAWSTTAAAPQAALRSAGRDIADRRGRFAVGKLLVIGQLALSLTLVVGAGLLMGTLTRLQTLDPGFNRDGVLLVRVDPRNAGYSPEEARGVNQEILERMRGLPGIRSASASLVTPIGRSSWNNLVEVDGYTPAERMDALVWLNSTTDKYFATLETPLRAGRDFDSRDALGSGLVAVIDETMARKFFNEPHPLGRHFRMSPPGGEPEAYEVIGVVGDTKYESIDEEQLSIAYFPLSQQREDWGTLRYQLRTDGPPTALISAVTNLVAGVHPRISLRFTTLEDEVAASLTRPRLLAVLSGFFCAVALLLAMIGLYGTLSYRVNGRRNEIGVRLALGAARTSVLRMVLAEVGRLALIGVALGIAVALASTRLLESFLFGVTATDYRMLVLAAVVLAAAALAAGVVPAWRAAWLDPMVALREEC